jgi:NAD dependent epimerase/dehydratase family enzyme
MVMSPERGSVFDVLSRLTRLGLGGPVAGGRQYVSWIHEDDCVRAVSFLIDRAGHVRVGVRASQSRKPSKASRALSMCSAWPAAQSSSGSTATSRLVPISVSA